MNRHVTTGLLLLGAIACYVTGMLAPAVVLLFVGVVLELVVWVRLLRRQP